MCRDILSIEEKDHIFNLKYAMFMEWYDSRIKYYNLKGNHFVLRRIAVHLLLKYIHFEYTHVSIFYNLLTSAF